ncbi:MAG: TraC family protein, partial [Nitrosomonas sp.]|nr:TraC family protein [Nitrosomonas sp.]
MFNIISNWGQMLAKMLGDRTQFGVNTEHGSIPAIENTLNYQSLNRLLRYDGYNPDTDLYYNNKSQGFILEAYPLLGANEETVNILTSVITDVLPLNTDLQIILWGSPKIGEVLDRFEQTRSGNGEVFEWLAAMRTDFLKKGAFESLTSQGSFILRDLRLFIAVSQAHAEGQDRSDQLISLREDLTSSLKSIQMPTLSVGVSEMISVLTD